MLLDIICFPHAGGSSLSFYKYIKELSNFSNIHLILLDYPGHGVYRNMERISDLNDLVKFVYKEIKLKTTEENFIFLGHSMGSVIAFEVNKILLKKKEKIPKGLILSGVNPVEQEFGKIDEQILKEYVFLQETEDSEVNKVYKEMNALIMHDINLISNYSFKLEKPTDQKFYILNSIDDMLIDFEKEYVWETLLNKVNIMKFSGDHNYIYEYPAVNKVLSICCEGFLK